MANLRRVPKHTESIVGLIGEKMFTIIIIHVLTII